MSDEGDELAVLLAEYSTVKEGGQHFWTITLALATLGLTALGGSFGVMNATCSRASGDCLPAAGWALVPLVPCAIGALFVQQMALQNGTSNLRTRSRVGASKTRILFGHPFDDVAMPVPSLAEVVARMFDVRFVLKPALLGWVSVVPFAVILMALLGVLAIAFHQVADSAPTRVVFLVIYPAFTLGLLAAGLWAVHPGFLRKLIEVAPIGSDSLSHDTSEIEERPGKEL